MKKLFFIVLYFVAFSNVQAQTTTDLLNDLRESEKYTFGFLDKLLRYWELIHVDTNITLENKVYFYEEFLASQALENSSRIDTIIESSLINLHKRVSRINPELGKHEVSIRFPIQYNNNDTALKMNLIRVKEDDIYLWKIKEIYINEKQTKQYVNDDYYKTGINEIEFEKDFSNLITELKEKKHISQYFAIDPSLMSFIDNYDKISITDPSYNIDLKYKITEIPYSNSEETIIGYKYLILIKDIANEISKKHGWHILDEGEMIDFYKYYDKNNTINFYLRVNEKTLPNMQYKKLGGQH